MTIIRFSKYSFIKGIFVLICLNKEISTNLVRVWNFDENAYNF